jgi:hypothetical protein
MERDSRKAVEEEGFAWGPDTIEAEIRGRVRGMIEAIIEAELDWALGAGRSQRVGAVRAGYRHGARERQLTTSLGKTTIMLPRARLKGADGEDSEWAQPDNPALSTSHGASGWSAARRLFKWHQHPAAAGSAVAAAARSAFIEGCGIAAGGAAAR